MTALEMTNQDFMKDSKGRLVPIEQVREQDKLRDQVASDLARQAIHIHEALKEFKRQALDDIQQLIQIGAEKYDVQLAGDKGNISVTTYDGQYKVQRIYSERIAFTEELEAAKELFGHCLDRWTEGADNKIRTLVDRAFRTNGKGQIKTGELLGLLRLDIQDEEWQRACQALKDSINVEGTTVYVRVYQRIGHSEQYKMIPLDLASV